VIAWTSWAQIIVLLFRPARESGFLGGAVAQTMDSEPDRELLPKS
jgi:hypothetical protein